MTGETTPPTPPPGGDAPPPTPWYTGKADAETVGYWQNRGWDPTKPDVIALEASKAHREAEKMIGVPANQILRLPADPGKDPLAMKAIWQRLGAPTDAKEYDFPALKGQDGKVTNEALDAFMRTTAYALNLPKDAAASFVAELQKFNAAQSADAKAKGDLALAASKDELTKSWGVNFNKNKIIAQNGALALGFTPDEINALESVTGYASIMQKLLTIGQKMGEGKYLQPEGDAPDVNTVEQAQEKLARLKRDPSWAAKLSNGDAAVLKEFQDLTKIIAGTTGID